MSVAVTLVKSMTLSLKCLVEVLTLILSYRSH